MYYDFQTTTHGKWILAGEHAVLRGYGALVYPMPSQTLTLSYTATSSSLQADYSGESGQDMQLLFWSVLERGMQLIHHSLQHVNGYFHVDCNIPLGVGMGASASLCVAVARWFVAQNLVPATETASFAQQLEHLFHGQSSGLDIAGVSATAGLYFQQGSSTPINQSWSPTWYLSSCKQMGLTSHCIQKVNALRETNASLAHSLDESMHASVLLAQSALSNPSDDALSQLGNAINLANECFQQWGLVSESLQQHMQTLRAHGAIAVKPTGSGGGGYVLSLWQNPPKTDCCDELLMPLDHSNP